MTKTPLMTVLVVVALVLIGLGVLFFALRPAPPAEGSQERAFDLQIRDNAMTPAEIVLSEGDQTTLTVSADRPTEVHLHGYDLEERVAPGETAELSFAADLTGRFEIEDHETQAVLGTLVVEPRQGA